MRIYFTVYPKDHDTHTEEDLKSYEAAEKFKVQIKYYRVEVSTQWAQKHDNGALISCGLIVDSKSEITHKMFESLKRHYPIVEVTYDEWNHSGCLSSCIRRGNSKCQW